MTQFQGADAPTFATFPTFLGLDRRARDAAHVVAGIPLDVGVTNRAGTRSGPAAIRVASRMLAGNHHPHYRVMVDDMDLADAGDFAIALGDLPGSLALIEAQAAQIGHLVALGGEHGITLPLLRALAKARGGPVGLVHFDAHADTWAENFGQVYSHGSVFYHALNEGLVDPRRMIQIGIRSPLLNEAHDWTLAQGVTILSAQDVHEQGVDRVAERIRAVTGTGATYLSFDIDCLDPAFAPGTGTPEIGGLASWQAQALLRRLGGIDFVGMDLVEVAPAYDVSEITALAGATMVWEYLALLASQGR
ncbi:MULTISPECIES: agmatinase [Acidiphilium]|jgi:agmatinase|uniref:agmatinase n=1 Tax=Acidiphilium TaxID=522 RepID=UPI001B8CA4F1|nr:MULTISPECIES: agmatinase [Acidiphilium]MBS3023664.1 agmatinase [Acidiphilium multivorum]